VAVAMGAGACGGAADDGPDDVHAVRGEVVKDPDQPPPPPVTGTFVHPSGIVVIAAASGASQGDLQRVLQGRPP